MYHKVILSFHEFINLFFCPRKKKLNSYTSKEQDIHSCEVTYGLDIDSNSDARGEKKNVYLRINELIRA